MKRIANAALALLLSALLLLPMSSIALAGGDSFEWTFSEEEVMSYNYVGVIENGGTLTVDQPFSAVEFTAPETGFYAIGCEPTGGESIDAYITWYGVSETYAGGVAAGARDACLFSDNADFEDAGWRQYYLEAEETIVIGVDDFASPDGKATFSVSGSFDVTALNVGTLQDVYLIGDSISSYEENGTEFVSLSAEFIATTTDGNRLYCTPIITGKVETGECALTATIGSVSTDLTVNCATVRDYIDHIEFPKDYAPTAYMSEDGEILPDAFPEYLLVITPDGAAVRVDVESLGDVGFAEYAATDTLTIAINVYLWSTFDDQGNVDEVSIVADACSEVLAELPIEYKEGGNGFFARIAAFFSNLIARIRAFFASLFGGLA
ncbi:MAG: hypothetical protein IK080_02370 [Clostridia bacterium]|nr:hypothetical protein [Clostridia bacterium]